MSDKIYVNLEFTPNPNTLKFSVNRQLMERGAANFVEAAQAEKSPLAKVLFAIEGVEAILIGPTFVTVTKNAQGSWDTLAAEVPKVMETHLNENKPVFDADWSFDQPAAEGGAVETKIREILDREIRPAVAMDGGDITFEKFDSGIVYLTLRGACSSCPSAIATLKDGVEVRLKQAVPEVREVVQI